MAPQKGAEDQIPEFNAPEASAVDVLSAAFDGAVLEFGRDDAMAATIAIVTSRAVRWKLAEVYCTVLRANAHLLENGCRSPKGGPRRDVRSVQ